MRVDNPFSFDFEIDDLDWRAANHKAFAPHWERCRKALAEHGWDFRPELVRIMSGEYDMATRTRKCRLEYDLLGTR